MSDSRLQELCDKVFSINQNIRFAGVITKMGRLVVGGMKPELESLEDKDDSSKLYVQFNGNVIVSIKDNGSGIDPEIMPKLFSKFATKSFSGTGLGLYISKNIIEAHDGKIWAENNKIGKGATFYFSLPIIRDHHQYQQQQ